MPHTGRYRGGCSHADPDRPRYLQGKPLGRGGLSGDRPGLQSALPDAELDLCPLSDGGEGFVETLVHASAGRLDHAETTDALGRPIQAAFGVLGDTVAIEVSAAAGLAQIPPDMRDPLRTTTYGVGELIAKAYTRHAFRTLLLAVGGSATVDGGVGLLEALGVRFLDASGEPIPRGGGGLRQIARIVLSDAHPVRSFSR